MKWIFCIVMVFCMPFVFAQEKGKLPTWVISDLSEFGIPEGFSLPKYCAVIDFSHEAIIVKKILGKVSHGERYIPQEEVKLVGANPNQIRVQIKMRVSPGAYYLTRRTSLFLRTYHYQVYIKGENDSIEWDAENPTLSMTIQNEKKIVIIQVRRKGTNQLAPLVYCTLGNELWIFARLENGWIPASLYLVLPLEE